MAASQMWSSNAVAAPQKKTKKRVPGRKHGKDCLSLNQDAGATGRASDASLTATFRRQQSSVPPECSRAAFEYLQRFLEGPGFHATPYFGATSEVSMSDFSLPVFPSDGAELGDQAAPPHR